MNCNNSPSKIAVIILVFAIFTRLLFNIFYVGINDAPVSDAQDYHQLALNLLYTGTYQSIHRSPLFPFFIAILYKLFGANYFIVRLVLSLLSSFTCLFIYKTTKGLFNEQIALIAMFISAIYWMLFYPCGFLLTETLCTFFLTGAVFFLTKSSRIPHIRYFIFSGIYLGLAALTRAFMLPFFLFLPFWAYVSFKNNRKLALKAFIVLAFTMSLVISPWTIRNYLVFHKFIPITSGGGGVFAGANNPDVLKYFKGGWIRPEKTSIFKEGEINWDKPIEADSVCWKRGISFIVKNPLSTAKL
ncbi:MAG TPA: ArnT family glycosyltransferase, partial [Candidatus Wunengus sp. YC60]|uniref:ArnT family glycosyltransferase n=1 Tax=Candidatus Wunengus sp. YC60 TaxID=3367697 RepID=UPI0040270DA8